MLRFWRNALYLLAVLLLCPVVRSQAPAPTVQEFNASIRTVQTRAAEWRKVFESVSVESLPVAYATGKAYDQSKYIVSEDLKMVLLLGDRAAQTGSLFAEINYMSAVQELQTQLQLFSQLTTDFTVTDRAGTTKVQNWSTEMSNIANGPLDQAFKTAYTTRSAMPSVSKRRVRGPSRSRRHNRPRVGLRSQGPCIVQCAWRSPRRARCRAAAEWSAVQRAD